MPNQWRFNEALSNVGNFWANRIMQGQERDRIEEEKQKQLAAKNQANIFARQLAQGGTFESRPTPINVPDNLSSTPVPFKQPQTYSEQFVPYDQQQKNTIAMQLASNPYGAETISAYDKINKMLNPEKKYKEFNGSLYELNQDGSIKGTAIQKQPEMLYDKESEYVLNVNPNTKERTFALDDKGQKIPNQFYNPTPYYLDTIYDSNTRKYVDLKGYVKDGKQVVKDREYVAATKNVNGQPHIATASNKLFNDFFTQQQKLLADYTSAKSGNNLYDSNSKTRTVNVYDEAGQKVGERAIDGTDVAKAMASHNAKFINLVKSGMPEGLKDWYKEYYNAEDKRSGKVKGNGNQQSFWYSLLNSWKKGEITPADFQYGMHLYRATYAEDPQQRFGATIPTFDNSEDEE